MVPATYPLRKFVATTYPLALFVTFIQPDIGFENSYNITSLIWINEFYEGAHVETHPDDIGIIKRYLERGGVTN